MNADDIGKFYTTDGTDIWMLQSYCGQPTVTMVNVRTGDLRGGAVGCLNLQPFKKLVIEEKTKP